MTLYDCKLNWSEAKLESTFLTLKSLTGSQLVEEDEKHRRVVQLIHTHARKFPLSVSSFELFLRSLTPNRLQWMDGERARESINRFSNSFEVVKLVLIF